VSSDSDDEIEPECEVVGPPVSASPWIEQNDLGFYMDLLADINKNVDKRISRESKKVQSFHFILLGTYWIPTARVVVLCRFLTTVRLSLKVQRVRLGFRLASELEPGLNPTHILLA